MVVTHELASIFTIGNNGIFLDTDRRTMIAQGDPKELRECCPEEKVRRFLGTRRGSKQGGGAKWLGA